MRFQLTQRFAAPLAEVADAFSDPGFYAALAELPTLGAPELLDRTLDGDTVQMRVRYRFTGHLSAAVTAVIDPAKLTWVDVSHHDRTTHHVTFHLEPDHYADRFRCHGSYRFHADPQDRRVTVRTAEGDVKIRMPIVGGSVERAIVSGLEDHLADEIPILESWLKHRSGA